MKLPNSTKEDAPKKMLSVGGLVSSILLALLGGLALVVRSLRNVSLNLHLNLKKDDKAQKKY
jgi:hypothetical protein